MLQGELEPELRPHFAVQYRASPSSIASAEPMLSFLTGPPARRAYRSSVVPPTQGSAPAVTVPSAPAAGDAPADAQKVTPWDVEGGFVDGKQVAIDYDRLIKEFGTRKIDEALLERFEKVTGWKPHPLLRRGSFFSHR